MFFLFFFIFKDTTNRCYITFKIECIIEHESINQECVINSECMTELDPKGKICIRIPS